MTPPKRRVPVFYKLMSVVQTVFLTVFLVIPPQVVQAQTFNVLDLPKPGSLVNVSESFVPVLIKGISLHPENPLVFDFIVDPGNSGYDNAQIRQEGERLIKYFLAALTVPEKDLWVNLSPNEADRIIPTAFGQTEMGRDLLAQDYILKQISASMIYPEKDLGKDFWGRVYAKAKEVYGTVKIPVSTFNKVWIIPDKAVIVENENTAFVAQGHLKVMLEEDYAALNENRAAEILGSNRLKNQDIKKLNSISSSVVREIILPEIEKEVNEGKNFAQLRQIYYSLVLAAWFKNNLKDNILTQVYADQSKISGVDITNKDDKDKIYERYMEAYREGVFNYIREDLDSTTQEMIPRKYFSGGADYTAVSTTVVNFPVRTQKEFETVKQLNNIPDTAFRPTEYEKTFEVITAGLERFRGQDAASSDRFNRTGTDGAMLASNDALLALTRPTQMELGMFDNRPVVVRSASSNDVRLPVVLARVADQMPTAAQRDQITTVIIAPKEANLQVPVIMDRNTLVLPVAVLEKPETIAAPRDVTRDQFADIVRAAENPVARELAQARTLEVMTLPNKQQVIFEPRGENTDAVRTVVEAVLPQLPVPTENLKRVEVAPSSVQMPSPVMVVGDTLMVTPAAVRNPALATAPVKTTRDQLVRFNSPSVGTMAETPKVEIVSLDENRRVAVDTREVNQPIIQEAIKVAFTRMTPEQKERVKAVQVVPAGSIQQPAVLTDDDTLMISREAAENPRLIVSSPIDTPRARLVQDATPTERMLAEPREVQVVTLDGERQVAVEARDIAQPKITNAVKAAFDQLTPDQQRNVAIVQVAPAGSMQRPLALTDRNQTLVISREAVENPVVITTAPEVTPRTVLAQAAPEVRELAQPRSVEITSIDRQPIAIETSQVNRLPVEAALRVVLPQMTPEQQRAVTFVQTAPRGAELASPGVSTDGKILVLPMSFVERPDLPMTPQVMTNRQIVNALSPARALAERPTFEVVAVEGNRSVAVDTREVSRPELQEATRVAFTRMTPQQQQAITTVQVAPAGALEGPVALTDGNRTLVLSKEAAENPQLLTTSPVFIARADLDQRMSPTARILAEPREVQVLMVGDRPVAVEASQTQLPEVRTMMEAVVPFLTPQQKGAVSNVQFVTPEFKLPAPIVSTDNGKTILVDPKVLTNPGLITRAPENVSRRQLARDNGEDLQNAFSQPSKVAIGRFADRQVPIELADADLGQVETMMSKVAEQMPEIEREAVTAVHVVQPGVKLQQPVITDGGRTLMLPRPVFSGFDMVKTRPINATRDELVKIASSNLGGIDFNPDMIKMEINKENGGIKVQFDPKVLEEIRTQGIEGFVPVILNVQPLKTALPLLTKNSVQEEPIQLSKL